jgi:tRNA pseudouridine32 synthase/23S rRNA pseudouridine746 synthase
MVPDPNGKPAVTEWRRLAERDGRALVLFTPRTGRTHQLRVHAASGLGLPIAGDPVYGGSSPAFAGEGDRAKHGGGVLSGGRMLLHAIRLRVPRERKPDVDASAPLPPHFLEAGFADAGL